MTQKDPAHTLDIKGLNCPMPLTWAKTQLDCLKPGEILEILATDPSTVSNFQAFTRSTGHELLEWTEEGGVFRLLVRKSS